MLYSTGPFDDVRVLVMDDTHGDMGRSKARNEAVKQAKGDWIFFLDADDLMHPRAFENVWLLTETHDAVWGSIIEYREGCLLERYQVPHIAGREQLIKHDPYITIQMGHFVKDEIAKTHPFDEDMDTGEDWRYYLGVWNDAECIKIARPLMINVRGEHSTGPRAANGKQWRETVEALLGEARENEQAPA